MHFIKKILSSRLLWISSIALVILLYTAFDIPILAAEADLRKSPSLSQRPYVDANPYIVIYLVPHQDDEVLTFSIPILNDLRAGKDVRLVLLSDGRGTYGRDIVNGKYDEESRNPENAGKSVYCPWHKTYHDPSKEHYLDPWISRMDVAKLRTEEFLAATAALGIPRSKIEIDPLPSFNYATVRSVILKQVKRYPNAEFKSMSPLDGHNEHAMVGKVVNWMYQNKEIKKRQANFGSVYTDRLDPKKKNKIPGYKLFLTHPEDKIKVIQALNAYKVWAPMHGKYAIGYHSVPIQFDEMAKNTYTKIFTTNPKK